MLHASWAGALLARLFLQHAWLDAVTLSFSVMPAYDDSGGFIRSVSCLAATPRAGTSAALPEDRFPDGTFEPDAAVALFVEALQDDEHGLYAALAEDPGGFDDLSKVLKRRAIAALLQQSPLDGRLAWLA